jgi:hypothetical protein
VVCSCSGSVFAQPEPGLNSFIKAATVLAQIASPFDFDSKSTRDMARSRAPGAPNTKP